MFLHAYDAEWHGYVAVHGSGVHFLSSSLFRPKVVCTGKSPLVESGLFSGESAEYLADTT